MIQVTLALVLALLGRWEVTLPVDGLTDANAAEFKERVLRHFAKIRNDVGESCGLTLRTTGDLVTIQANCNDAVKLADLRTALKGSTFELRPRAGFTGLNWNFRGCQPRNWQPWMLPCRPRRG